MKKTFLVLIATFALTKLVNAQSSWVNYKIDSKLSVKMPTDPKPIDERTNMAMDKDSNFYMVAVVDFVKVAGIDSVRLAAYAPQKEFADGIKNGMLKELPGLVLGEVKIGKWNGHYCYTIEGASTIKKLKFFTYDIIIGSTMYGLTVFLKENSGTNDKDYFFNSLVLN